MYITFRERLLAALGTAIIVALLGTVLLLGLSVSFRARIEAPMALLNLRAPPPPPPLRPPVEHPRAKRPSGKASPANLRNKATPVVAPPPVVRLPPPPPPLVLAPKPGTGMAAQTGASDRPGPGTGAGGEGNGTGSGGSGDGDGGGGRPPRPINEKLKFSYLSADVQETLRQSAGRMFIVGVSYRIEEGGNVSDCRVTKSSGIAGLDSQTCNAIIQHFRYHPGRDRGPQATWYAASNTEGWQYDPEDDPQGH